MASSTPANSIDRYSASHAQQHALSNCYPPQLFRFKRHDSLSFRDSGLWRIQSGFVRSLTWNESGDFIPLGFWEKGDVVGSAIAQTTPYKAQCLTPVVAEHLGSRYAFTRCDVLAQVRQSNELLQISHCRNAETRLLSFLCWIAQRFGSLSTIVYRNHNQSQQMECYRNLLKLTHQEIGESIGITRVTVTRLLKGLERDGLIQWSARDKVVFHKAFQRCCENTVSSRSP